MIELLSPVGDYDCLKAAVQNGADSVYFGNNLFNAREYATNFNNDELKKAIIYAKLRNVKVNFVLNTLIKNDEFEQAVDLANYVYSLGVDSIIVQDIGLATYLIKTFPDLAIHASTQMTTHNLDGVLELQDLGFKRVVLSRELSIREIEYICNNSSIEIETFIHGALCISYSGQCLFSSSIGGRSGNRGKCAQPCRLPYKLIKESSSSLKELTVDKGYLLSPRDLCGLNYIPDLIKAGVKCLKIEGRMKSPLYVATVTRIYKKYINLAYSNEPYVVDEKDIKELMQVFNRGGFSEGNFNSEPNTDYVFKEKPNNIGLYIGNVSKLNSNKGLVTLESLEKLQIGDKVSFENEDHSYTISELTQNNKNIKESNIKDVITIGRMKGNINLGDKVYKLSSISSYKTVNEYINKENIKIPLVANITVKKDTPISLEVTSCDKEDGNYFSMSSVKTSQICPIDAISNPISSERIKSQLSKTTNTPFEFKYIHVNMDENIYIPKISTINELRRECIKDIENQAIKRFENIPIKYKISYSSKNKKIHNNPKISLLLNTINYREDYTKLYDIDSIYIPFKYFIDENYSKAIKKLSTKANIYIYMPVIIKDNYRNIILSNFDNILQNFNIKGVVISNLSSIGYLKEKLSNHEIIANSNFNIFNNFSIDYLKQLGITKATLSPELDKKSLMILANNSSLPTEILVYGKLPVMYTGYCLLGSSNKCYPTCKTNCRRENSRYFLKDRLNMKFRVIPDNLQTISTIYNSKITSIKYSEFNVDSVRISIIDRNVEEINEIIEKVKNNKTFTGSEYTKGNLNKHI